MTYLPSTHKNSMSRGFFIFLIVLMLSVFSLPQTAVAAGTPYHPARWAGVIATKWHSNFGWRDPRVVKATWQVPCLPTTADGVYGSYDQWIGVVDANGTSMIQVGVRSYHLMIWNQVVTGYFAWVVNTNDPNARTAVQLFRITKCGMGAMDPIISAEVDAY